MKISGLFRETVSLCDTFFFKSVFVLFILGGLFGTISQVVLYLRQTPFGLPFVLDIPHYLPHAIFYEWYGMALLAMPFFFLALFFNGKTARLWVRIYGLFITLSLLIDVIHAEFQRHMGIRFSLDFIATYSHFHNVPNSIWGSIADDNGGAYSTLLVLGIPLLFIVCVPGIYRKLVSISLPRWCVSLLLITMLIVCYFLPFLMRTSYFGSKNRQYKVEPPVFVIRDEIVEQLKPKTTYDDIDRHIGVIRNKWLQSEGDKWVFDTEELPFQKIKLGACFEVSKQWNVILIVLETFRAMNMKLFNNDALVQATPFLEELATSEGSAYWRRFISNSQPTVYSFMSIHTSLLPHSSKTVARAFSSTYLDSLPGILKDRGYRTLFFAGSDPDWDNQRAWLTKWYDETYYNPRDDEQDRRVFRHAAKKLIDDAQSGKPFLATLFSITNHISFDSPEPQLNLFDENGELSKKIYNTMRYTDDVVKEFIDSVKSQPWFEDTIVIVTGDHGYDLGERGSFGGFTNIRHETNWVPLIIHSTHPRQPQGQQNVVGSHVDIAPTLLDMLGICEPNGFVGHSLLKIQPKDAYAINIKSGNIGVETAARSFYFGSDGTQFAYNSDDILQKVNIIKNIEEEAAATYSWAASFMKVSNYLYEKQKASQHTR